MKINGIEVNYYNIYGYNAFVDVIQLLTLPKTLNPNKTTTKKPRSKQRILTEKYNKFKKF